MKDPEVALKLDRLHRLQLLRKDLRVLEDKLAELDAKRKALKDAREAQLAELLNLVDGEYERDLPLEE